MRSKLRIGLHCACPVLRQDTPYLLAPPTVLIPISGLLLCSSLLAVYCFGQPQLVASISSKQGDMSNEAV